jgi:hypothetical protein
MTTTTESAVKSKRYPTRRQWVNGSIWLAALVYWQLVGTPMGHFMILSMPNSESVLNFIGKNGHTWFETFSQGWGLIGSELVGIFVVVFTLAAIYIIWLFGGIIIGGIRNSMLPERPPTDD